MSPQPCEDAYCRRELASLQLLQQHPHENVLWLQEAAYDSCLHLSESQKLYSRLVLVLENCMMNTATFQASLGDALPEAWARPFCSQMFLALTHLASLRILHNDLKPENLLLSGGQGAGLTLKIGDFGCSAILPDGHEYVVGGRCITTWAYASPEVFQLHACRYSFASDVWSAGDSALYLNL